MNSLIRDLNIKLIRLARIIRINLFNEHPPPGFQFALVDGHHFPLENLDLEPNSSQSILEQIFDGFLLAVPKHRRPVEARLKRKHGSNQWGPEARKLLEPKKNIKCCETCGNFHEAQHLCGYCYAKVKEESKVVWEAMAKEFKGIPVDQEVALVYQGEKREKVDPNRRILEIPKERPPWWSKNLLPKTVGDPLGETNLIEEPEKIKVK